jgi:hypothetical protein
MTPAQAREYMADFARTIGVMDHHIEASIAWIDSDASNPVAPAAAEGSEVDRNAAQQEVAKFEIMMREQPGEYWKSPENQERYTPFTS